jgi:hypothetical protein
MMSPVVRLSCSITFGSITATPCPTSLELVSATLSEIPFFSINSETRHRNKSASGTQDGENLVQMFDSLSSQRIVPADFSLTVFHNPFTGSGPSVAQLKSSRRRTALLLLVLALLGILLTTVSAGMTSPWFNLASDIPHSVPSSPPPPSSVATGKLLVKVLMNAPGNGSVPISGAEVAVDSSDADSTPILLTYTNSSGEAQSTLAVGNYTLTVTGAYFGLSRDIPVVQSSMTVSSVNVNQSEGLPVFSDLPDADSSGFIAPWQPISMALNASAAKILLSSESFYLDAFYSPGTTGSGGSSVDTGNSTQVQAKIVSESILQVPALNGSLCSPRTSFLFVVSHISL